MRGRMVVPPTPTGKLKLVLLCARRARMELYMNWTDHRAKCALINIKIKSLKAEADQECAYFDVLDADHKEEVEKIKADDYYMDESDYQVREEHQKELTRILMDHCRRVYLDHPPIEH